MASWRWSARNSGSAAKGCFASLGQAAVRRVERATGPDRRTRHHQVRAGTSVHQGEGGRIYYKHIDDLRPLDMRFVTAAERVEVGWLKERVERRKRGAEAPPIPPHLR